MLDDLLGHAANKKYLKAVLKSPPSMLFLGPEGVGKRTVALHWVSELLNDERVLQNKNPDVHLVEPDGKSVKIDQVRDLLSDITDRPCSSEYKVYIIDGADTMTKAAANMLLKPLEEPPPSTLFVLVGENPNGVLPTIRSRCQELEFQCVSRRDIFQFTKQFIEDDQQATLISNLSSGSFRTATKMIAGSFLSSREQGVDFLKRLGNETASWIAGFLKNLPDVHEFFYVLKALVCDLVSIRNGLTNSVVNQDLFEHLIPLASENFVGPLYDAIRRLSGKETLIYSNFQFHFETELLLLRYKK